MADETQNGGDEQGSPWGNIGIGLFMLALGVGAYFYFAHLEQEGGSIRTHALILLAYKTLGKGGVLGLFGLAGGFFILIGLKGMFDRKK